ncbi:MAG: Dehydrogenase [Saliniramus fredricksonii]|uniref:Dehydrogenase n=1 Tax=Saliniramus fredricksonii TaxID=1653334 RepID=A0A0P7YE12_9HYPH|nr:SDR family oxidoreductase [Saliniramus fredricksonii]KPQ12670.1 MAG: Dehydrogenase [Saliniramus fredricksonii]SCC82653.1 NAD(P)-dependent dehydrogenase, short-chain alcohol dehydrogenase family [Saliniramus fredricksonii]
MSADYAGRVVLITGAAGGFGSEAARCFSKAGAKLVLTDRDADALAALVGNLPDGAVVTQAGDITDEATAEAVIAAGVAGFGRIDVAINNAGIAPDLMRLSETPAQVMEQVMQVNVLGTFHVMRREIALMQEQFARDGCGGVILNVASVAGLVGAPMLAAYAASKHAVVGLTRSAAIETAKRGVRINALCPSFAATPMVDAMVESMQHAPDEALARLVSAVPMGRTATAEEVVGAMLWICSDANSFMTGNAVALDGGLSAG